MEVRATVTRSSPARTGRTVLTAVVTLMTLVGAVVGCSSDPDSAGSSTTDVPQLVVRAVSTRPELVSGGDVLVAVDGVADGATPELMVDDAPRPGALAPVQGGGWTGLVDGLPLGRSTIRVGSGKQSGELAVTNHLTTGPLFSGPHQTPFACTTEANGLGRPLDTDCSAPTQVRWDYYDTAGELRPLPDRSALPPDVATAMVGDTTVPLVVRTESGVLNRSVYWISTLDPTPMADDWEGASDGWNGDLVYRFGGGCGTTYSQGKALVSDDNSHPAVDRDLLVRGYAVATSTLNTFQVQCNDVLSAETALMVKEHFAEQFGPPRHTIGDGGSGGAIQQFLIVQNYPGILDAVSASAPFPDALSLAPGVSDCGLLNRFYGTPEGAAFTEAQRTAVNGHAVSGTCGTWQGSFLDVLDPTTGCDLPSELVYDPVTNPTGARCTLQDSSVNVVGTDPDTGFARRPLDNIGVQYGLEAVRSGAITVDQFLALNEQIGGYDIDGNITAERERATEADLRHLYETGRIVQGGGDLGRVPMIAVNSYSDPSGDIHDRWRIFSLRERLDGDDGVANPALSIWTTPGGSLGTALTGGRADVRNQAIDALATWLTAIDDDGDRPTDDAGWAALMEATRPEAAMDRCLLPDGTETSGDDIYSGDNPCTAAYPLAGDPRRAAGGGLAALTGKCRLAAIDADAYDMPLSPAQEDRLRAVFPDGVCDWGRPGVGQVPAKGTWRSYGTS